MQTHSNQPESMIFWRQICAIFLRLRIQNILYFDWFDNVWLSKALSRGGGGGSAICIVSIKKQGVNQRGLPQKGKQNMVIYQRQANQKSMVCRGRKQRQSVVCENDRFVLFCFVLLIEGIKSPHCLWKTGIQMRMARGFTERSKINFLYCERADHCP